MEEKCRDRRLCGGCVAWMKQTAYFPEEEKGQLHRAENEHTMENWKGLGWQDTEGWCLGSKLAGPPVSLEPSLALCEERI